MTENFNEANGEMDRNASREKATEAKIVVRFDDKRRWDAIDLNQPENLIRIFHIITPVNGREQQTNLRSMFFFCSALFDLPTVVMFDEIKTALTEMRWHCS